MLPSLRTVVSAAALVGAASALPGQSRPRPLPRGVGVASCAALGVDTATFEAIDRDLARSDTLWGGTGSGRSAECVRDKVARRAVVLVAVRGEEERTGGIAVIDVRTKELEAVWRYPAARELKILGPGRLLFTFTPIRELLGAGLYESRYVVLCALTPEVWAPCFDLPKDRITRVFGEPLHSLEEHNRLTLARGRLRLTRRLRTAVGDAAAHEWQLAPSTLAIP
jgi:hypothetical protein